MTASIATNRTASFIDPEQIIEAYDRISREVVRTPLLRSDRLDKLLNATVFVKAENLQSTGSFKFRGALNRVSTLTEAERAGGIVAWSSGNHALAISAVAARKGIAATILMPADAPLAKIEGARGFGATVRLYDRATENREALGQAIADATGAVIIPPYDDPAIIAGQGTVAIELIEQVHEACQKLDLLAVSCSGGGLTAGCALALQRSSPATRLYCIEPEGFDDTARSLAAGSRVTNAPGRTTLCDALQVPTPGELTFPINRQYLSGAVTVSDGEVRKAIRVCYDLLKLVVEPGGVAPLAAALAGKLDLAGKTVALVLSGGNVDAERFSECIAPA
ncbi:threonine/serine dehydratase [Bosea sp. F3-2]|uniref:threonine ammonia-lyase n=1 Tax=Bosea sp. F3-2 TaxID=2599640 RepID=UPI0011EC4E90|nr:threonine/serine dehydratase [Bosea sp. F3-2]QEL22916.1 threonine/serine dehydratase [Bosea sp. F3-2]